ncbi:nuclear pore complex protein-like protein [Actinidia rufa]|uniref:Nuclear pore complex protein-like protein n=1 Tax=Actinidia rufa TaxID=165716 RepID=A0A7J0GW31_9ERIC|nr:nuclear pore complex protein-like protein [Actinidia rufa]
MRENFDLPVTYAGERQNLTPPSSSTTKDEVQWLPLQNHPVFAAVDGGDARSDAFRAPKNLLACDGASRLYCWDSHKQCLHRISIRLGDPDQSSVLAASPSKVLQADVRLPFVVNKISINRNGSAILLAGSDGLCVMYLYGRASMNDGATICRTVSIGSQIYFNSNNIIRTLEISWHPYSDTHLGILSSDSVFRLFDLSSALGQPEQEYYLQPVEPGRCRNASSICPVDFSFGGDHLWDRFSIFVLFSDGSIYILCPVVPFGSVYKWESMLEIYSDAQTFRLKSANPRAVSNSNFAISWLEATFPELHHQETGGGNLSALKAQPYTLFDASISMQGPLLNVCHGGEEDSEARVTECEGRAVSLLYNTISKDSVLVTAWSGGQLQIDALADEIQPVWVVGDRSIVTLDQTPDHTVWSGHPPPLLRLAMVDLALPGKKGSSSLISMFVDPLIPERIYTLHDGGIDSIVLHFLPFTNQTSDKDESIRTPSVHSVLSTCQGQSSRPSPLFGFVALSDSFGYSWIVGLTSSQECIVLEMKSWDILLPILVDTEKKSTSLDESRDVDTPDIISKELLDGPKPVLFFLLRCQNCAPLLLTLSKVYFELKHHGPHLKKIIEDQHDRLREAQQKLLKVEEKQEKLEERVSRTTELHSLLEERLQRLRKLPGMHKRPLSKAEREFKSDLDRFTGVELDALHSSIEALNARLQRYTCSLQNNLSNQQRQIPGRRKNYVQDNQILDLQSSISKLSIVNGENTKKVKLLESALQSRESSS